MVDRVGFHEIRLKSKDRRCTESAGSGLVAMTRDLEGTDPLHSKTEEAREDRVGGRARNGSVGKAMEEVEGVGRSRAAFFPSLGPLSSPSLHFFLSRFHSKPPSTTSLRQSVLTSISSTMLRQSQC